LSVNGHFEFEAPLVKQLHRLAELRANPAANAGEIERLESKIDKTRREVYRKLTRWQKTQVARHPLRPDTLTYIRKLCTDFIELHGDRSYADDPAIVAGLASYHGRPVAVVGHQKGRDTRQKLYRNFGMPRPEGYRKALRVMKLAEKFDRPVISFIDTPGADPGVGAEERGQAEAIAVNLREMAALRVPIVVTVTGEGGSGGALAIGVGDRVHMLEFATYSVISPEACSAILWRGQDNKEDAAENLRLSAPDLKQFGIVDRVIEEPVGGAHSDPDLSASRVDEAVRQALDELSQLSVEERIDQRYRKFRSMGVVQTLESSGETE
jgi:acetyl-CoA carboxylase carboxyl transferase subunit alpha